MAKHIHDNKRIMVRSNPTKRLSVDIQIKTCNVCKDKPRNTCFKSGCQSTRGKQVPLSHVSCFDNNFYPILVTVLFVVRGTDIFDN